MADLRCDLCELEPSDFMLTHTQTGETQAVCGPCLARSGLEMAKAILTPAEILERLGIVPDADTATAEAEAPAKRGRKSKAEPPPQPDPDPAPPERLEAEPPAIADGGDTGL